MKVVGGSGGVRIRLDTIESQVLAALFTDLADVVESDAFDADDPVRKRLYPAGYGADTEASDAFSELTEESLRTERALRARACADDLNGAGDVVLDTDAGERWVQSLNDLRLALGTRLEITDETDSADVGDDHPQAQEWGVYHWLTALQDSLVHRLMR
ncbi:MAG: hypothetical protein QOG80_1548 [Pseudonocardiales bacterium]|jgi:hypothetical protein|nr:hypothetical protein [Pseudonocardiales bacterium]